MPFQKEECWYRMVRRRKYSVQEARNVRVSTSALQNSQVKVGLSHIGCSPYKGYSLCIKYYSDSAAYFLLPYLPLSNFSGLNLSFTFRRPSYEPLITLSFSPSNFPKESVLPLLLYLITLVKLSTSAFLISQPESFMRTFVLSIIISPAPKR